MPEQGSLFEITDVTEHAPAIDPENYPKKPDVKSTFNTSEDGFFKQHVDAQPHPDTDVNGPFVDVLERNRRLTHSLGTLAAMSRAKGLEKANALPSVRGQIAQRYRDEYEDVHNNTRKKADRDAEKVPGEFAELWGLEEVVASGMVSPIDAEDAMAEEYRLFNSWYGSSGESAERRKHAKRWLSYQQDIYSEKKNIRQPKAAYPRHPRSQG
jgi:hypothetical protein